MVTKSEMIGELLTKAVRLPGIDGVVLVSRGGLIINSSIDRSTHPETFAAMAATIMGAATAALGELKAKNPSYVYIHSELSPFICVPCGEKAILVAILEDKEEKEKILEKLYEIISEINLIIS